MVEPMHTIDQTVNVTFHYPVHFTEGLFAEDNPLLTNTLVPYPGEEVKRVLFVVDEGVADHHPALLDDIRNYCEAWGELELAAPPIIVQGGEGTKNNPANVERVQRAVHEHGIDRHAFVVVIGGGAVIDMVGYAAATSHRGVRLVRVPTTVLSQNDSAVGVKNSVNAFGKKNFLGTFAPPFAVLNDPHFLTTLEQRDWLGGVSEAVKVALLKDARFFKFLEQNAEALVRRDMRAMNYTVYRCAELHLHHIASSGDPFEFGSSRPLDFGHWAAHKLEAMTDYTLRHGEAVAIGIALDSTYAYLKGMLSQTNWRRIMTLFDGLNLATYTPELSDAEQIVGGLNEFREHLGGRLTIMLLEGIGQGVEVHEMDAETIVQSINLLKERSQDARREAREKETTWKQPTLAH